jgi:hypothetical protein
MNGNMSSSQHLSFGGVPLQHSHQHQPTLNTIPSTTSSLPPAMAPAQQQAFLHNAQLPGLDMATVLKGITPEQLAYIGQLYQNGQIPLPPGSGPVHPPAAVIQTPPVAHQSGASSAVNPQEQDPMSADKEDGEWEEEELAPQVVPDFLRPPPTGPRKRSGSIHMHTGQNGADKRTKRQPSPPRQAHSYDRRRPVPSSKQSSDISHTQMPILTRNEDGQSTSSPRSIARQRAAKHEAAKNFILAAYRAGYTFDDLSREVGDARMLRILYTELGLSTSAENIQARQAEVIAASSQAVRSEPSPVVASKPVDAAPKISPKATPVAKPTVKPVAKPVIPPKAPATVDRSAYLAKLQAAKNKKNEDLLKSSKPVDTAIENASPAVQQPPPAIESQATQTQIQPTVQQPRKAVVQTDLIRKRLEALKGEQARRQEAERLAKAQSTATPSSAPAIETATPPANASLAMRPTGIAAVSQKTPRDSAERTIVSPGRPFDFASQFPGLPGLFMTGTPPQAPATLRASVERPASPKPQAAAEVLEQATSEDSMDLDRSVSAEYTPSAPKEVSEQLQQPQAPQTSVPAKSSAFSSGQATPKHPFNQGKYDSNDDSVIIHVSDEEESELDDMDEDEDPAPTPVNKPAVVKPGPIRNFPAPVSTSVSAPGTPGATTPGGTAYERKLQEIQEMNRRIEARQNQTRKPKPQPAPPSTVAQANASTSLPGLSVNIPAAAAAVAQPKEQQAAESNQQMEAKLARLKEEAVIISEQRQAPQSNHGNDNNGPVVQAEDPGVAEDANSDMSDDDDAMDLSSGEDSDSSDEDDVETHVPVVTKSTSGSQADDAQSLGHDGANGPAQEDDDSSSSDDTDSSTEYEEDSDGDYEPAPAVPESDASTAVVAISSQPVAQYDAELAPELQPSTREEAEPTPEVFLHETIVFE